MVFNAILLYRITVETGQFDIVRDSVAALTEDRRLQALLIAFAFGAFIEGAAGFGTPVAVSAAMLAGLGFPPFYAAAICLLANTAPVAFGSIGTPILTLAGVTGLPMDRLSAGVGRICAPISLIVPSLPGGCHGRLARTEGSSARRGALRHILRRYPAAGVKLRGSAADGHTEFAGGHGNTGGAFRHVEA